MGYVAKTVPLSSALSIKTIFIVIGKVFGKSLDPGLVVRRVGFKPNLVLI